MRRLGSIRVLGALAAAGLLAMGSASCSSDDDSADGTLGVIPSGSTPPGSASPAQTGATDASGTAAPPQDSGAGFVSIGVQVAASGIDETISLDRSTVAVTSLDPLSLDAECTPLDGGEASGGVVVSVVDLRRLAGDRVVSAVLRYSDAAPGDHDMTLEVGSADQVTTIFPGTVSVATDGMSGTFEGEGNGSTVTGSFACSADAIVPTTIEVPLDAGEEVPDASPPAAEVAPAPSSAVVSPPPAGTVAPG